MSKKKNEYLATAKAIHAGAVPQISFSELYQILEALGYKNTSKKRDVRKKLAHQILTHSNKVSLWEHPELGEECGITIRQDPYSKTVPLQLL